MPSSISCNASGYPDRGRPQAATPAATSARSRWPHCDARAHIAVIRGSMVGPLLPGRASMQLHHRLGAARDETGHGIEHDLGRPVQGILVHLVERFVHEPGEPALDEQVAA